MIAITNDDGFFSNGIKTLIKAVKQKYGKVIVLAPNTNFSCSSRSLNTTTPIKIEQLDENFYICNSSPATCARILAQGILGVKPERIISGINDDRNLGGDIVYSGTIGAAFEGIFLPKIPIAISLCKQSDLLDYNNSIKVLMEILENEERYNAKPGQIMNVNIPDIKQIKEIKITKPASRYSYEQIVEINFKNKKSYSMGHFADLEKSEPGTDKAAIDNGYASVSILSSFYPCK